MSVAALCCAPCRALQRRASRADDSDAERRRKHFCVPLAAGLFALNAVTAAAAAPSGALERAYGAGLLVCTLLDAGLVVGTLATRRLPERALGLWLAGFVPGVLLIDLDNAGTLGKLRVWTFVVIVVDGCLVFDLPDAVTKRIVCSTVVWLAVAASESAYRWGLFDIGGRVGAPAEQQREMVDCAAPPCAQGGAAGFTTFYVYAAVFVIDFWLTRGFATSVRGCIDLTQRIAGCLGDMDIAEAAALVDGDGAGQLPPEMRTAFHNILRNLRQWRESEEQRRRKLEDERDRHNRLAILDAEEKARTLPHPMILTPAARFLALDRLTSYEELRDAGALVILDTQRRLAEFRRENTIVFLSHQWLAWGIPDPSNIHFESMRTAILSVVRKCPAKGGRQRSSSDPLDCVYIWADFSSIAQEHRGMQLHAISALPAYASQADAFVVVAPRATHKNTQQQCDFDTYNMRGWCRAEMLSKVLGSGIDNFYVLETTDGEVQAITAEWLDRISLSVFDGDFSCCAMGHRDMTKCDKEALMPAILGLYGSVLRGATPSQFLPPVGGVSSGLSAAVSDGGDPPRPADAATLGGPGARGGEGAPHFCALRAAAEGDPAFRRMVADKPKFFPPTFIFRSCEGWEEERDLFGVMIGLMEEHVASTSSHPLHAGAAS